MRVQLLGTGAADGWPQPFCRCASCEDSRRHGRVRARSGVLVDDVVLLDPSPDVPGAAARAGLALDRVTTILVGHAHHDHLDPALLLARGWVSGGSPLQVHGPASALERVRPWVDPALLESGAVALLPAHIGIDVELPSGHIARALPAEHGLGADGWPAQGDEIEAVLWEVTGPDGVRLLHAADTGPPPETTLAQMAPLDLLLVEETFGDVLDHGTAHLDLATLPTLLADLRRRGIVHPGTQIVAVHLAHFNPPEPELARRLAAWGARPGHDLEVLHVGPAARGDEPPLPASIPRRVLITGGARSGKSRAAEALVAACPEVVYVATAGDRAGDAEWAERVARHRERRPLQWRTAETAEVAATIRSAGAGTAVLVDCLTLWVTGLVDRAGAWDEAPRAREVVRTAAADLVDALASTPATVVLVSNEVGSGIVPEHAGARLFADLLGETSARVAGACDQVLLAVAGQVVQVGPGREVLG